MDRNASALDSTRTVPLGMLLASEVAVGTVINVVLNLLFSWLVFPRGAVVTLSGIPGLAIDLLPATLVPAFMMTLLVTTILRRRIRAGLRVERAPRLPVALPRPLVPRATVIALLALVIVAAPTWLALRLVWPPAGSWTQLLIFKLIFSAFHATMMTPIVILAALRERRSA